jgi:hypothetical protein
MAATARVIDLQSVRERKQTARRPTTTPYLFWVPFIVWVPVCR